MSMAVSSGRRILTHFDEHLFCIHFFETLIFLGCGKLKQLLFLLQVKGIRALLVSKYYNLSRAAAYFFYARHRFWVAYFHNKLKR